MASTNVFENDFFLHFSISSYETINIRKHILRQALSIKTSPPNIQCTLPSDQYSFLYKHSKLACTKTATFLFLNLSLSTGTATMYIDSGQVFVAKIKIESTICLK